MLAYLFAMVLNAVVVLTCDCTSCHNHSAHKCPCEMCVTCEGDTFLSQHCECTHSHENSAETGIAVDAERVLKLMKVVVAELPRTLVDLTDITSTSADSMPTVPLSVSLDEAPLLATGGLRAPPVFA